jgi:hypothetical protein
VHGVTATPVMQRLEQAKEEGEDPAACETAAEPKEPAQG